VAGRGTENFRFITGEHNSYWKTPFPFPTVDVFKKKQQRNIKEQVTTDENSSLGMW
jgi:hypothetical protein